MRQRFRMGDAAGMAGCDAQQICLSAFNAEGAGIAAGRVMLARLRELARQHVSFEFETTLASRSFAPWLRDLKASGYSVHLSFLWLPSAEFAIDRVEGRVRSGGHGVPAATIRRRYHAGLRNLFSLYQPLTSTWAVYDGSGPVPRLIAERVGIQSANVYDRGTWALVARADTEHEA